MSNPIWDESEHHIPIEILALHADGDLSPEEELRTAEHCKVCWLCRTRSEEIERGIRAFVEYRRDVLLPGLPSWKATRSEFQRLVRERLPNLSATSVDPPARSLHRFAAALPRPVRLAGAISVVLVVVLLLFPIAHRSRLTAAEFVSRVRQSEGSTQPGARKFLYQKVRIRRGNQVVIRECYKGLRSMTIDMPHQPQWAATLVGPMSWQDPLNGGQFVEWRQAETGRRDIISESQDRLTLTTIPASTTVIRRASVTVRRSDWHTVSKRIEIEGQPPIEADELAFETRDISAVPPALIASQSGIVTNVGRSNHFDKRGQSRFSASQLEDLEVEARVVLFDLGAGLTGDETGITFLHHREGLAVETVTSTEERRELLVQGLTAIPGVQAKILAANELTANAHDPLANSSVPAPAETATANARFEPILKKELNECLGDEKSAAERANQILLVAGKLRGLTALLRDLAERYPQPQLPGLSASSREQIAGLANRIVGQMSETLKNQDSLVVPILERTNPSLAALGRAVDYSRRSRFNWQTDTEALFRLVSTNDKLVARLFAETTGFTSDAVSPEEQIRSFIDVDQQLDFFLLRRE